MSEPDYRFTLANERTFLAWLRTALALLAAGVAIVHLLPEFGIPGARDLIGALVALLGTAVAVASIVRWRAVQAAMARDEPLPHTRIPVLLGAALSLLSLLVLVLLLIGSPA